MGVLPVRGSVSAGDARDARSAALSMLQEPEPEQAVTPVVPPAAVTPVVATSEPAGPAPGSLAGLTAEAWPSIVSALGVSGMPRQLAANAVVARRDGSSVHLVLESGQDHLNSPRFIERLAQAVTAWAGESVSVVVRLGEEGDTRAALNTPSRQQQHDEASALDSARKSIESDQRLARLLDDIDGKIDPANVRPLPTPTE